MDGGPEQRRMAERLRHAIRRNAQFRRERNANGDSNRADFIVEPRSPDNYLNSSGDNYHRNDRLLIPETAERRPPNSAFIDNNQNSETSLPVSRERPSSPLGEHSEIAFLAKYIDDIFPFLFPFYRPSMMETGRSWLLILSQHSDVARHAMLCLAAYFFAVFLKDEYPGQHDRCRREIWIRLGKHTSGYVGKIQSSIQQLRAQPESTTTVEKARSMEGIVQAILFEAALGRSGNWKIHLSAALELFEDIFRHQTKDDPEPKFMSLLRGVGQTAWYTPVSDTFIWDSEQAGLRFFVAILIFVDAIGSSTTGRSPRLLDHYSLLLADNDISQTSEDTVELRLSRYVGCQNWVIVAIGETAALAERKAEGRSSTADLTEAARRIETRISEGLLSLDAILSRSSSEGDVFSQTPFTKYRPAPPVSLTTATYIWAQAARIHLEVDISGLQRHSTVIRGGVQAIMERLQGIQSPSHLRSFMWPLVVAGCFSEPGDEQEGIMTILNRMAHIEPSGQMTQVQEIVSGAWNYTGTADQKSWSLSSCLQASGVSPLLI